MNKYQLLNVIKAPYQSEKSSLNAVYKNQYTFKVDKSATKLQIKKSVELFWDVKVKDVNVLVVKGKNKHRGRQSDWKKAYVTLQEGFQLDIYETQ